ncbi:hypothetical protein ACFE04_030867 [Oxalis oulophora]
MASINSNEVSLLENGNGNGNGNVVKGSMNKESHHRYGRTAHSMSSSSLRKKSELTLVQKVPCRKFRQFLVNIQQVILGTKLAILFPAIPLAIAADMYNFGRPWIFALSLLGLTPLAERISYLTEQIAYFTGPTVGGLLNATCGNITELVIAVFALTQNKVAIVKYSLLGSVLSNLLLVLGTSLLCGGIANLRSEQRYDRRQADINSLLLLLAVLCHSLPLMFRYAMGSDAISAAPILALSRASAIVMLITYFVYLVFQLWTHRQWFEAQEEEDNDNVTEEETAEIGFWSAFIWLVGMTLLVALLSEYIVDTIEDASNSWGLSVSFISIILLPIVGNAAEHAGAIIFAFKNKLDISLGVAMGSATQIGMFAVPFCVIVAWIIGVPMDLNFNLIETGSLALAIIVTAFTLQDGTSHYMKGLVLLFCYVVIAICFFVDKSPLSNSNNINSSTSSLASA